jgi:class 3 adenylate cyclase/alpha-beta hydrolase superfamily lysophospholipase
VHYAVTTDGLSIAYSMAGDGPPLIFVRGLNSHAQQVWDDAYRRPYLMALTHAFTVVVFDARGNGMSDPVQAIDLDSLVEDARAVAADLDLDRFTVYGQGFGAPVAIAFAAGESDRVDRLILYCAYLRGRDVYIPDFFMDAMKESPQAATAMMGHASYPDTRGLPPRFLTPAGLAATPETALLYFELARTVDVSELAPAIRAPALVMQPEANRIVPLELGDEVASVIPGARFERISSGSYNPWAQGAVEPTLTAISDFVGSGIPLMPTPRPMTVLVTDLVGSTEMTHRLGEERARDLFRAHDDIVRAASRRFRGQEVKHTGDGIMVRFDEPGEAVACAASIQERLADRNESVSDDPLHVRVGIAHGDVVEEHDGLFGMTVVLAVRVMDQAEAGQILVSESVCASVENRYNFSPATPMELKGFPDQVPVFELLGA